MVVKIQIPKGVTISIKKDQEVDFKTPLFKKSVKRNVKVSLAKKLEIKPEKIFFFLKKVVGEEISKGEVLAIKKGLWGQKKFYSEYDGVLKEINHQEGSLVISVQSGEQSSVFCFFKGKVTETGEDYIKLDIDGAMEFPLSESSQDFGGETYYPKTDDINLFKQEDIDSKVLLMKKVEAYNQVRLEVIGASGFITVETLSQKPSINYATIKKVEDWEEIVKSSLPFCLVCENSVYFYK